MSIGPIFSVSALRVFSVSSQCDRGANAAMLELVMMPKPVKLILLPTDMSRDLRASVRYGIELAAQLGAELRFFAVLDSPSRLALVQRHGKASRRRAASFREKIVEDAKTILQKLIAEAAELGVRASGKAVVAENIKQEVLREARESAVDLILVESSEQSLLQDFLFGDNSEEIMQSAPCSVLTMKLQEEAAVPASGSQDAAASIDGQSGKGQPGKGQPGKIEGQQEGGET